jgi:uroporphyrinogen-III synthase
MTTNALHGVGVLITRPIELADTLLRAVTQAGGRAIHFPAVRIVPLPVFREARQLIARADDVFFVSPTAVRVGAELVLGGAAPTPRRYFGVGEGTARALQEQQLYPVFAPDDGADSEALLRLPQLADMHGRHVAIVRGEGGRELLAESLRVRGAIVDVVECYRRAPPSEPLPMEWRDAVQAVTATSSEIVDNLMAAATVSRCDWLKDRAFFVTHPRIAQKSLTCGVRTVCVVRPARGDTADCALSVALNDWFMGQRDNEARANE